MDLYDAAIREPGVYCYVGPTRQMVQNIAWDGVRASDGQAYTSILPAPLILERNEAEQAMTVATEHAGKHSRVLFLSGNEPTRLRGLPLKGCVFPEYSQFTDSEAMDTVLPTLNRNGGWLLILSTPLGVGNHYHQLWQIAQDSPDWWTARRTIHDTVDHDGRPLIDPGIARRWRRLLRAFARPFVELTDELVTVGLLPCLQQHLLERDTVDRGIVATVVVHGQMDALGFGDGPDARHGAEALHALIVRGDALDRLVGVRELAIEVAHDGEERRDQRERRARQGQGAHARHEGLGARCGERIAAGPPARYVIGSEPPHSGLSGRARAGAGTSVTRATSYRSLPLRPT